MDIKHWLTFFGLLSDLLGAVLLSIPMIWNTRAMARAIQRELVLWKRRLYGPAYIRHAPRASVIENQALNTARTRVIIVGGEFLLGFLVIAIRLVEIQLWNVHAFLRDVGKVFTDRWALVVVLALPLGLLVSMAVVVSPSLIAKALLWLSHGERERKIGFVGLGVLCLGFFLQAWVNVIN